MKKMFKLFSTIFVMIGVLALVGCSGATSQTRTTKFKSDQDMFAFAAASTANVFSSVNNGISPVRYSKLALESEEVQSEVNMDKVNKYLQMMETLLVDNGPVVKKETASDRTDYETKLEFTVTDLAGLKQTYVIYYNQVVEGEEEENKEQEKTPAALSNEEEKEESKKDEETKKDEEIEDEESDDLEEQEQEYTLNGIAIMDGKEYIVTGEKELDVDEYELEITISLDKKSYVTIKEEVEEDEHEYEYTVVENGKKTLEVEFELENAKEVEIEIKTTENGVEAVYEFEKEEKNGQTVIVITHEQNGKVYEIEAIGKVNPETNKIEYTYKDKTTDKEYHYQEGEEHADKDED